MDKWRIPEEARLYIDALKELIAPGVHAATKLEDSPLIDLPVVRNRLSVDASREARADFFIEELERIVRQKLQGGDRERALRLFGLGDYAGMPQRKRYEEIAKSYDKHASWESFRKEPLDRFLVAVYLKLYREGAKSESSNSDTEGEEAMGAPNKASRKGIVGGEYRTNLYESLYNMPNHPGDPREILQTRVITATADGLDAWRQSSRWWRKTLVEMPDFTLFGPGELSVTFDSQLSTSRPGRVFVTEVKFPKPLKAGQRVKFSILKKHPVNFEEVVGKTGRDRSGLRGIVTPIDRAIVGVRFPKGRTPRTIWHYEDLPEWLAPGVAIEENSLVADASGYIDFEWTNLLLGHSYGLAWEW